MATARSPASPGSASLYDRIYAVVRQIPAGHVATYGQVASIVGACTPRMVGYAMAAVPSGSDVPWQRVINSQGKISPRANRSDEDRQMEMLEDEGVCFDQKGKVNLDEVAWLGPDWGWLEANGFEIAPGLKRRSRRTRQ